MVTIKHLGQIDQFINNNSGLPIELFTHSNTSDGDMTIERTNEGNYILDGKKVPRREYTRDKLLSSVVGVQISMGKVYTYEAYSIEGLFNENNQSNSTQV